MNIKSLITSILIVLCLCVSVLSGPAQAQIVDPHVFFPMATQANQNYSQQSLAQIQAFSSFSVVAPMSIGATYWSCNGLPSAQCAKQFNARMQWFYYVDTPGEFDLSFEPKVCGRQFDWIETNHPEWLAVGRIYGGMIINSPSPHDLIMDVTDLSYVDHYIDCVTPAAYNGLVYGGQTLNTTGLTGHFMDDAGYMALMAGGQHTVAYGTSSADCPLEYTSNTGGNACSDWGIYSIPYWNAQKVLMDRMSAAGVKYMANVTFGGWTSRWTELDALDHPPTWGMNECVGTCTDPPDPNTGALGPMSSVFGESGTTDAEAMAGFNIQRGLRHMKFMSSGVFGDACNDLNATYLGWSCEDMFRSNLGLFLMGYDTEIQSGALGFAVTTVMPIFPSKYGSPANFHLGHQITEPTMCQLHVACREFTDGYVYQLVYTGGNSISNIPTPGGASLRICTKSNWLTCDTAGTATSFNLARNGMVVVLKAETAPSGGCSHPPSITNCDNADLSNSAVKISTSALHSADYGSTYTDAIQATGGTTVYTYTKTGSMPPGLSLNSSTGAITGTPTTAGVYTVDYTVNDNSANACPGDKCDTKTLSITITTPQSDTQGTDSFTDGSAPRDLQTYNSSKWIRIHDGGTTNTIKTNTNGTINGVNNDTTGWVVRVNDGGTYTDNQYMQAVVKALPADGSDGNTLMCVAVEVSADTGANRDLYETCIYKISTVQYTALVEIRNGSLTTLNSVYSNGSGGTLGPVWAVNDVMKLEILNNVLTVRRNGQSIMSYDDTASPLSGGRPGLSMSGGSSTVATFDTAQWGNLNTPVITSTSPPSCVASASYSYPLTASGGTGSGYVFTKSSGTYPPTISISGSTLTGTCVTPSDTPYQFGVIVSDSGGNQSQEVIFTVTISNSSSAVSITNTNINQTIVAGQTYCLTFSTSGGVLPFTWVKLSGTIPGLTLDSPNGKYCGTPTTVASAVAVDFQVTDSASSPTTDHKVFNIAVTTGMTLTPASAHFVYSPVSIEWYAPSLGSGTVDLYYSYDGVTYTTIATGLAWDATPYSATIPSGLNMRIKMCASVQANCQVTTQSVSGRYAP